MSLILTAVLVLAAGPDAGTAPFAWDVPGQTQLVPVGQKLASPPNVVAPGGFDRNGLPLAIFLARSTWELDALLLHYAKRFTDAGFFIPPKMGRLPGLKLPRLVALDDERMVSFLVYGWPEADGTTTLVLGAADLGHRKAPGDRLPTFPGAKNAVSYGVEMATALSFTAKASEAEIIDFYRTVLPSGGWVEREPGSFVKDGRVVRVLSKRQKGVDELSVVVLEEADSPPIAPRGK